jgi:hypothetical protein
MQCYARILSRWSISHRFETKTARRRCGDNSTEAVYPRESADHLAARAPNGRSEALAARPGACQPASPGRDQGYAARPLLNAVMRSDQALCCAVGSQRNALSECRSLPTRVGGRAVGDPRIRLPLEERELSIPCWSRSWGGWGHGSLRADQGPPAPWRSPAQASRGT